MKIRSLFLFLVTMAALTACGGESAERAGFAGNPQQAASATAVTADMQDARSNQGKSGKAAPPLQALKWRVTDLGTLPDTERSVATDINNAGQIVGYAFSESFFRHRPFVYQNGSMAHMLLPLRDMSINPTVINNNGQIAGYTYFPQARDPGRAFLYVDGTFTTMGNAGGANDLNDDGKLVGNQTTWELVDGRPTNVRQSAYLYYEGNMIDLTAQLGVLSVYGINQQGDIAGENADYKAYVYRDGQLVSLGALSGDNASRALAINDQGMIVGASFIQDSYPQSARAFLYANGALSDLNAQGRFASSQAIDINATGQVLIDVWQGETQVSYLYQNGRFLNLSGLRELRAAGWSKVVLRGLNDLGQLVGSGIINGNERALLLTPSAPGR